MAWVRTTEGVEIEVRMADLVGRHVRTRSEMQTGIMSIPAGAVCVVTGTWRGGVSLRGPKCPHCGVSIFITKVHRDDVELMPKEGV